MEYVTAPKPAEVATEGLVYAGDTSWLGRDDRFERSVDGEAVKGWRAWLVASAGDKVLLRSVKRWIYWRPGYDLFATCARSGEDLFGGRLPEHRAPSSSCRCGIHAYRDAAEAIEAISFADPPPHALGWALGEVALWGEILETPDGWRASHAYPTRLLLPSGSFGRTENAEAARDALTAYGVPADVVHAQSAVQFLAIANSALTH
jgi:hypothetical protein